jgi:cystathionine beta-lyase
MHNFDDIIDRAHTAAYKLELRETYFGQKDVLPLWVADMDFSAPPEVIEAIQKRAAHPVYGYTIRTKRFKAAIQSWLKTNHQWEVSDDWIEYVPGVVPALAMSLLAFTQPGDGVIIQPPIYPPFYSVVKDNQRKLVVNPLVQHENRYLINFEELELLARDPKNKVLILCSPHNPVGRVWSAEELERIGEICLKNHVLILSDEIHADLAMFGHTHTPMASISDSMASNCVTYMAPSKTFNIAGFSTAYIIASNADLLSKYKAVQNGLHLHMGHLFGGTVLEAAYEHGQDWLDELLCYLEDNILFVHDFITERLPFIKMGKPEATYLLWLDFKQTGWSQKQLVQFLTREAKVGLNDGLSFGKEGEGYMRLNVGSPRLVLKQALEQIEAAYSIRE